MSARRVTNLAMVVDARRRTAIEAARTVARIASEAHVSLQINPEQAGTLDIGDVAVLDDFPRGADLLVSLGGDGTLLRAAHYAVPLGIPIIGIDFGKMGFLTAVGRHDYPAVLESLLRTGVNTEPRTVLEATLDDGRRILAINDVHIDRKQHGHTLTFDISIGGEHVADIPADGIVVSSPTGSTAYFLSAGGPILAPGLDAFGIAPICPHTLFSRPLVVAASETIRISVPRDAGSAHLYADGRLEADLAPGSSIEIAKAPHAAEFVRLDDRHFFRVLERKLHWGTSIKRSLRGEDGSVARQTR
jgi:NAD+ kinase